MTVPERAAAPDRSAVPADVANLVDGNWHRLHPATPFLRGGVTLVVILGIVVANLRERLLEFFLPQGGSGDEFDPISYGWEHGYLFWALLGVLGLILLLVLFFYISWRKRTFRITADALELREGIVFRSHRRASLDRIQSVSIVRPMIARLFGAAKMDVSVAGENANVKLEYVHGRDAESLRLSLLTLASGAKLGPAGVTGGDPGAGHGAGVVGVVTERVNELLAPELDAAAMQASSVVRVPPGRLIASVVLSVFTVLAVIAGVVLTVVTVNSGKWGLAFAYIPGIIAVFGYYYSRTIKQLRYSIAATPSGIRVGAGLFTVTNDTIPPGRIQAVRIAQPLLWRPFGWWTVTVNRAGVNSEKMSEVVTAATVLPVGSIDDAAAVVGLMLNQPQYQPVRDLLSAALHRPAEAGFTLAPRRAWIFDPIAWRRTGFRASGDLVLLRRGFAWRHLDIVPLARVQSLQLMQGPLERRLRMQSLVVNTMAGAISPSLPHLDETEIQDFFEVTSHAVVAAMNADTSHRWAAPGPVADAPVLDLGDAARTPERIG